jgi:hypothetical protein
VEQAEVCSRPRVGAIGLLGEGIGWETEKWDGMGWDVAGGFGGFLTLEADMNSHPELGAHRACSVDIRPRKDLSRSDWPFADNPVRRSINTAQASAETEHRGQGDSSQDPQPS